MNMVSQLRAQKAWKMKHDLSLLLRRFSLIYQAISGIFGFFSQFQMCAMLGYM